MNFQASKINEQTPWQEMTPGGEIYEGGTAKAVRTGEWRSDVPVWDPAKCKQCLLCAPFCPDSSIPVSNGKRGAFDRSGPLQGLRHLLEGLPLRRHRL